MRYAEAPETSYYYDAIRWANGNQIFTEAKQAADALTPNETVTRGGFAVMLRNYDRTKTNRMPTETVLTDAFEDMDETTPEVREAVLGWAYPNGILRGTSEATTNPDGRLTRAYVAAMLSRYDKASVSDGGFKFRVAPPHTMAYCLERGADFILRVRGGAFTLLDENGKATELYSLMSGHDMGELNGFIRKGDALFPVRIRYKRKDAEALERTKQRLKQQESKKQTTISEETKLLNELMVALLMEKFMSGKIFSPSDECRPEFVAGDKDVFAPA